jgi:ABC-type polysaccharide/polyol phosphate export permease
MAPKGRSVTAPHRKEASLRMFRSTARKTRLGSALAMLEVIFHASVRNVRKSNGNAIVGLLLSIFQTVLLVAVFYFMFQFLGMRGSAIRGDFMLYLMSGVVLFMIHTKAIGAVIRTDGPTSPMMKHAPMNSIVSIASAALASLYTQVLSVAVVLYLYHVLVTPITIDQPVGAAAMVLLSWASGVGIGMVFLAAKPWNPEGINVISSIYLRVNMIASGKMFLANMMPTFIIDLFDWNPLFHTIDQGRGFLFLNYFPHYSSLMYPVWFTVVCVVIGLMGEFTTSRRASISWGARA